MDAIRRASGILFYLLGSIVIVLVVLVWRGSFPGGATLLNVLDVPLIFLGSIFGGTSLYVSIVKEKRSFPVMLLIAVPVGVAIVTFIWINFMAPFAEV